MKAYKVFNSDWTCRGLQYAVGETTTHDGPLVICESGLHACKKLADCFNYYAKFDATDKVAEVECDEPLPEHCHNDDSKFVTAKLTVVRELTWHEVLDLVNTGVANTGRNNSGYGNSGDGNSGDRNSGDRNSGYGNSGNGNSGNGNSGDGNSGYGNSGDGNSGYGNSGYGNSGNRNSGYGNSGDGNSGYGNSGNRNSGLYNKANYHAGAFNTHEAPRLLFNKPAPTDFNWQNLPYINLEPTYYQNDKLYARTYHEAWALAWLKLSSEERDKFLSLPNFDAAIFEEITGISTSH